MRAYRINEIFYSLQGEGMRAGTANLFLRFTGCNLLCSKAEGPKSIGGFDCDTEFTSGSPMTAADILVRFGELAPQCKSVILTGGEPSLQLDAELIGFLKAAGYYLAIETNGSAELLEGIDWITVSPKVAEHAIRQRRADEVKYVRGYGQALPETVVKATHHLISPAFNGLEQDAQSLSWCIALCKKDPTWRLSVQQHKLWSVR